MKISRKKFTVTFMVPAYNEETNLENAINSLVKTMKDKFKDYEILIFNDKSSDRTGEIAEKLAKKNKKIKVIHNKKNMSLGYNYIKGAQLASMEYYAMFPGDNENSADSFYDVLKELPKADIIIPYPTNSDVRPVLRRILSNLYVFIFNTLFKLNLKYYNGTVVYKTKLLKGLTGITPCFAYSSEILVKLLKMGGNYKEIGIKLNPGEGIKKTSAFRIKNILMVLWTIARLFYEINIRDSKKYPS